MVPGCSNLVLGLAASSTRSVCPSSGLPGDASPALRPLEIDFCLRAIDSVSIDLWSRPIREDQRAARGARFDWWLEQHQGGHGCQFQCQEVGFPHQCRVRLCAVTRAPTADGQKTRLLQPSPPSPPPGLCVPMLGGSGLYRGGGYWPPWGNGGNCQNFISRLEAEPTSRPASRLRAASRGSRCGGVDASTQDISGIFVG